MAIDEEKRRERGHNRSPDVINEYETPGKDEEMNCLGVMIDE